MTGLTLRDHRADAVGLLLKSNGTDQISFLTSSETFDSCVTIILPISSHLVLDVKLIRR